MARLLCIFSDQVRKIWDNTHRTCLCLLGLVPCMDSETWPCIELDSKVHVANMGPIWGLQDPCGPMLAPWTLLSGKLQIDEEFESFTKLSMAPKESYHQRNPKLSISIWSTKSCLINLFAQEVWCLINVLRYISKSIQSFKNYHYRIVTIHVTVQTINIIYNGRSYTVHIRSLSTQI